MDNSRTYLDCGRIIRILVWEEVMVELIWAVIVVIVIAELIRRWENAIVRKTLRRIGK